MLVIEGAAQGGGVAVMLPVIAVAQIGVGVEVQDGEVLVAPRIRRMAPAMMECSPPNTSGNLPIFSTSSTIASN